MTSTRRETKRDLEQMIDKLKAVEMQAINIGLLYQKSDVPLSDVMFVISEMVKVALPLIEQANENL